MFHCTTGAVYTNPGPPLLTYTGVSGVPEALLAHAPVGPGGVLGMEAETPRRCRRRTWHSESVPQTILSRHSSTSTHRPPDCSYPDWHAHLLIVWQTTALHLVYLVCDL